MRVVVPILIVLATATALAEPTNWLGRWYATHTNAPVTNTIPMTNILVSWDTYTGAVVRIEGNTNLDCTNWFFVTNVYLVGPTSVPVENVYPQEYFRACATAVTN